ncbi:hypothetical protein [Kibdelosporangium aridum]|uniref:Uncharacterized protein n=1 Tax=Kibdelosporangium aridum TaxID=2030 RepID=A0A1Y5XLJ1_KIBAR|nr:hypothetical protein [Kibdelosporangium aridum]SMC99126.1 hypothetical protein SAMN05661093_03641 [Kibdelosporangium aridum]
MDAENAEFDLLTILGVTHGFPTYGSHQQHILEFLTQSPVPGPFFGLLVTAACREWLLELHPVLRDVPARPEYSDGDYAAVDAWAEQLVSRIGTRLVVRPIPPERRDRRPLIDRVLDVAEPSTVFLADPTTPDCPD